MIRTVKKIKWNELIIEHQIASWMLKKDLSEEVIFRLRHVWQELAKDRKFGGTLTPRGGNSSTKAVMSVIVSEDQREDHVFWVKEQTEEMSFKVRAKSWKPWEWILCYVPCVLRIMGKPLESFEQGSDMICSVFWKIPVKILCKMRQE